MKYRNKISGATLAEILIVLAITTIVVGLAFSALNLIRSQYESIRRNFDATMESQRLEQQLWVDFHRYVAVNYNQEDATLFFENGDERTSYRFGKAYSIRNKDTLNVQIVKSSYYFRGEEVNSDIVDAVKLSIGNKKQVEIFVFKKNDAKRRMIHELSD